ncbi:N-acetyltransferase [Planobispora rosea]|uniref:N-acetyltransferase n=1 Tax=Planobispora rosea TaxID=35762 RepID=A0A8J3RVU3_PLARO|nr:GNAT family N-acetyltransferase [Planobispora rosea]GGS73438.1 N-acetyltransferase [Planobispora rosea]GIH81610.1 N-acetyltransferase [Planobispora rosea]
MTVKVTAVPEKNRFEAQLDGTRVGHIDYLRKDGVIIYTHTEVDRAFEGRGIGGELVREALDAARAEGAKVVPRCSFVRHWIDLNPGYADLVGRS